MAQHQEGPPKPIVSPEAKREPSVYFQLPQYCGMLLGEPTQVSWELLGDQSLKSAEFENWGSDRDEEGRWVLEQSGLRYIYI